MTDDRSVLHELYCDYGDKNAWELSLPSPTERPNRVLSP